MLRKIFSRFSQVTPSPSEPQSVPAAQSQPPGTANSKLPFEPSTYSRQHSEVQRELVGMVLKDTMRLHGVPSQWLGCEVNHITRYGSKESFVVRVVIHKWNTTLLRYLPALENQLRLGLDRYEPGVDHSGFIITWQFSADCGCPHHAMPSPAIWASEVSPPTKPKLAQSGVAASRPNAPKAAPFGVAATPIQVPQKPGVLSVSSIAAELTPATQAKAKPKFDLPPSDMDNLPSTFAATEPGGLR